MSRTGKRDDRQRGFTLIEVVVVLAIVAVITALAIPELSRGNASLESSAAAEEIAGGLRMTRNLAMVQAHPETFTLDTARGVYRAATSGTPHRLPKRLRLTLVTTTAGRSSSQVGGIRFYADGSSDGGGVLLSDNKKRTEILVDWLTGGVSIEELAHATE